jgi:hypothetical protein
MPLSEAGYFGWMVRRCIAALHKKCFPTGQKKSITIIADATRRLSSQFRRFSCSPLEVYTFTINGPRFSVGPLFLPANIVCRRRIIPEVFDLRCPIASEGIVLG